VGESFFRQRNIGSLAGDPCFRACFSPPPRWIFRSATFSSGQQVIWCERTMESRWCDGLLWGASTGRELRVRHAGTCRAGAPDIRIARSAWRRRISPSGLFCGSGISERTRNAGAWRIRRNLHPMACHEAVGHAQRAVVKKRGFEKDIAESPRGRWMKWSGRFRNSVEGLFTQGAPAVGRHHRTGD